MSEHENFQNMKYKRWPSERLHKGDFFACSVAHQHWVSEHIKNTHTHIFSSNVFFSKFLQNTNVGLLHKALERGQRWNSI